MENNVEYLFAFAMLGLFLGLVYADKYFQKKGKGNRGLMIGFNIVGPVLVLLFLTYMAIENKNYVYGGVAAIIFVGSINRLMKSRKQKRDNF
jgi:hypothetical protein